MTAIAISIFATVIGWKLIDVWADGRDQEHEALTALALRIEELETSGRVEEVERRVEKIELREVAGG